MKNRIYKISIILTGLFLFLSCGEDFLDTKPIATSSPETFYTTLEAADMAVTNCYSMFKIEKTWDLSVVMILGSVASDEAEAAAGGKGDIPEYQDVDQLRHTPASPRVFSWPYGYMYRAIAACNIAMYYFPDIPTKNQAEEKFLDQKLGEVYFLRAFNFFYLSIIFGGVPKVDHVLAPDEYKMGRSEIHEIFTLIKSDLHKAIQKLPTKSQWGESNVGRASKGAAMAQLAKVYLYESSYAKYHSGDERFNGLEQHWDSAAYWAEQVINSGDYELVGLNGERFNSWRGEDTPAYQYIFMMASNGSREQVFEITARNDGLGWFYSRGTALVTWCAPRRLETPGGEIDHGWGWWAPSPQLIAAYDPDDPRKDLTVLDTTDLVLHNTYGWVKPNFDDLYDGTGNSANSHKYECSPEEVIVGPSNWPMGPINVKMIRIADVYLWAAEAYFEMGQTNNALPFINAVRQRARLSGDNPDALPDLTTLTHEDIEHERLVELALEGHRFWDLIRWNLGDQYLNHTLADGDQIVYRPGIHEFFPLPDAEILQSGGALKQYPGWN